MEFVAIMLFTSLLFKSFIYSAYFSFNDFWYKILLPQIGVAYKKACNVVLKSWVQFYVYHVFHLGDIVKKCCQKWGAQ